MTAFSLGSSQPYLAPQSAVADAVGAWTSIGSGLESVEFEWVFDIGAGTVTGVLWVEKVAQLNGTIATAIGSGTRILIPQGAMHTSVSGFALASAPSPSVGVTVTAASSGRVSIMLGRIPPGQIRAGWDYGSGAGGGSNLVSCYAVARGYTGR